MQSSANKWHDDQKLSEMPFMHAKNSNGPSKLPCGTPLVTLINLEKEPAHTTRCVRDHKKSEINGQFKKFHQIP